MKRARSGLIFGAAGYAIAYAAGAIPLRCAVVGLAGAAIAAALT